MTDQLDEYRRRRDARRTPEPVPRARPPRTTGNRFVIQQHHARSLHWDVRLERDGVLVSFAVPRGLPRDRARNHLARHTEDHPLEYLDFAGEIPAGEYGGGKMIIHDRGTFETGKWRDDEIGVTFHGERTSGRYVFFRTGGNDWMVRRMDPPEPGWQSMPEAVEPMLATRAAGLPPDDPDWGYELSWGGRRAALFVSGGRVRVCDAEGTDVTSWYPELRPLGDALAPLEAVLDGEIVAFDGARVSPELLERRKAPRDAAAARRAAERTPAQFLAYDLLWLEGHSTVELVRYAERRELLEGLELAGDNWQTPPYFPGGGAFALEAARAQGLPGVVAKRLDSPYLPGRRSRLWRSIDADHGAHEDPR
ncbi:DNA polymerase ligase N-terminal domain-containing protein [Amorphoplanes digitatis]|uniref:Bifunctional non-homologous end joining protein LigD n=1 Tax=Actinoplanes digitatis TaxID=1868 RepID=A0A7W7MTC1_9ACTN|nr:DNA polymerase ligase N-terminal domain-containing protein [Actinoplanes digitatis]MBB4766236.1 bifunctional non-homologous end joining protein LigD [Actinoplanes digitatis]GID95991.1 ATP-dependent DNA ligase [Actinoplanes digitatis]